MSYLNPTIYPITEHYKRFQQFCATVDENLYYRVDLDLDRVGIMYIDYVLKYNSLDTKQSVNFLNRLFEFIRIPNELTFKEKISYYQLVWKAEHNHE